MCRFFYRARRGLKARPISSLRPAFSLPRTKRAASRWEIGPRKEEAQKAMLNPVCGRQVPANWRMKDEINTVRSHVHQPTPIAKMKHVAVRRFAGRN
jgi:hypothetical protein